VPGRQAGKTWLLDVSTQTCRDERKSKRVGNLAEFFASLLLRNSGLKVRRSKDRSRATKL
jgi:hypothetical protein